MLSNAYLLAKFGFDSAENEPAKNLQNFVNFPNFANPNPLTLTLAQRLLSGPEVGAGPPRQRAGTRASLAMVQAKVKRDRIHGTGVSSPPMLRTSGSTPK